MQELDMSSNADRFYCLSPFSSTCADFLFCLSCKESSLCLFLHEAPPHLPLVLLSLLLVPFDRPFPVLSLFFSALPIVYCMN